MEKEPTTLEKLGFAAIVIACAALPFWVMSWAAPLPGIKWKNLINAFNSPPAVGGAPPVGRTDYFQSFDDWQIGLAMLALLLFFVILSRPQKS